MDEWEDPWVWTHGDPGSKPSSAVEQWGGLGKDSLSELGASVFQSLRWEDDVD